MQIAESGCKARCKERCKARWKAVKVIEGSWCMSFHIVQCSPATSTMVKGTRSAVPCRCVLLDCTKMIDDVQWYVPSYSMCHIPCDLQYMVYYGITLHTLSAHLDDLIDMLCQFVHLNNAVPWATKVPGQCAGGRTQTACAQCPRGPNRNFDFGEIEL